MKNLILGMLLLATAACNPELQQIGSSPHDLVKYFKVTSADNGIGDGVMILANIGDKRLLTFYLKQPSGKYAHTDIMIIKSPVSTYEVESIHSQTPDCKLNPDVGQPRYFEQLLINGTIRNFNREEISVESSTAEKREIGC